MTKLELYNKLNITVKSLKKIGKATIINNEYVIKPMIRKADFYDYLLTRGFNYFPNIYSNISDEVELMDYISDKDGPDEQRLEDGCIIMGILHLKTAFTKNISIDRIKEIYETGIDELNRLLNYYQEIQNIIEEEIYMSPANYLLIRNISLIYKAIFMSKDYLHKWYKEVENTKSIKYSYIHGNLRKEHILEDDKIYIISWDNSKIDFPVKDIDVFYRNSFYDINILDLLSIYEKKYPLKKEERYYLYSLLLIPPKFDFYKKENEYVRTEKVTNIVNYVEILINSLEDDSKKTNNNTDKQDKN